jgi:hypothetical protein
MRSSCRPIAAIVCLLACAHLGAIDLAVDDGDIARALKIAGQPEDARAQFHAPYILPLNDATIERMEVITEFRRCVLLTEEQLQRGNWMFSQGVREAREALQPWHGRVSVVVRLRFHPHNTFLDVPDYELRLGAPAVEPVNIIRTPVRGPLSGRRGDLSAPLLGAIIETEFAAEDVGQSTRLVSVWLGGEMIGRAAVPFGSLD